MKTTLENGPEKIPKMGAIKPTYTITFGDQGENHAGMQKIGKMASEGFTLKDLQKTKKKFEELGAECELIHLNDYLDVEVPGLKADDAYVLIIRKGADFIMQEEEKISNGANAIFVEQTGLQPDKKALMRGRVVNKRARYNLCFDKKGQKANYEKGQGTIIAYDEVPYLKALLEALPTFFGSKAENMIAEGNYYYDPSICGIGFHGDSERRKVIALRLGSKMNMQYQWFLRSKPIGQRFEFFLKNGDMYVMSEKAVGTDWKSRSKLTLRHAAGCPSFTTIESSPFELGVDDQPKSSKSKSTPTFSKKAEKENPKKIVRRIMDKIFGEEISQKIKLEVGEKDTIIIMKSKDGNPIKVSALKLFEVNVEIQNNGLIPVLGFKVENP